jgi:hypothetical protein
MEVEVNFLAVLLAAIVVMVVGSVWYAKPVFGTTWAKLVKLDDNKMRKGAAKAMAMAFVAALVTAYVLAHVTYLSYSFFDTSFMSSAISTAFWLWLGISATTIVTHNGFEQKPDKLTILALGNQLVTFLAMGVIIGWLAP